MHYISGIVTLIEYFASYQKEIEAIATSVLLLPCCCPPPTNLAILLDTTVAHRSGESDREHDDPVERVKRFRSVAIYTALSGKGEVHEEARLCSKVIPGDPDYLTTREWWKEIERGTVAFDESFLFFSTVDGLIDFRMAPVLSGFLFREGPEAGPLPLFLSCILSSAKIALKGGSVKKC